MNLNELIIELQKLQDEGYGESPVLYAAYYHEEVNQVTTEGEIIEEYILLSRQLEQTHKAI